jgi:hypothetical protein
MGVENFASTGIRSPDRPARSESLYRLSYPGPHFIRTSSIYSDYPIRRMLSCSSFYKVIDLSVFPLLILHILHGRKPGLQ